jgi:hypothetical protein
LSLQALADRYDVAADERAVAAAISSCIEEQEATIARLTRGGVTANLYAGELAAARQNLRFAITDLALLSLEEDETAA